MKMWFMEFKTMRCGYLCAGSDCEKSLWKKNLIKELKEFLTERV